MRNTMLAAAMLTALSSMASAADFTDEAEVIAATPIYQTINEPTSDCWNEAVTPTPERSERSMTAYPERERSYAGAAVGGVAGGLIGNQIGAGNGRVAATAAGAVIGAMTGDRVDNGDAWRSDSGGRSYLGPFIGAVAGGLLGAQVGAGNGRAAAAAVGAVAGALVGDRLDNGRRQTHATPAQAYPETRTAQRCRSVDNYRQVVTGYTVLYRYNGREAQTVLPYKPGATIKMGIAPVDGMSRPSTRY